MKVLYVFTNKFPYTTVEPYLESEVLHYDKFDKIYIFSLIVKRSEEKERRNVPDNVEVFPIRNDKVRYILGSFRAMIDSNFLQEVNLLRKESRLNIRRIITLLIYISRAHVDSKKICRLVREQQGSNESVFYTYRFEFQPYTALLVKQKMHLEHAIIVSRAHGYDLYEERSIGQYIPLRSYLLENLDYIYPCSKAGENYLKDRFPLWKSKISVRYLGTNDYGIESFKYGEDPVRIVSCSNIIRIKRIDRIIEVLSHLKNRKIEWVHIGSGEEENDIRKMAKEKLGRNANVIFMGRVKNIDIMRFYKKTKIDIFLNLSDGEGLPVSIMEAFSFGIPCVATDVGGTSEIIENGKNGFLVDVKESDSNIASVVDKIISMSEIEYMRLRAEARKTWEEKFSAEKNYGLFVSNLAKLTLDK